MRLTRLAFTLTLAAATLAACGGGDEPAAEPAAAAAAPTSAGGAAAEAPAGKINANTATEAELMTIPGVGKEIAHEIEEYRPYDATTGEAKFRKELAKYIAAEEIDGIVTYLDFS